MWGCSFQIWQYFFENSSPKIPKEGIFGPKVRYICFFLRILQYYKIEGTDFKYDNRLLNFSLKKLKAFLVSNLGVFIFWQNFAISQIRGCWLQIWQYYFRIAAQNYPNQAFLIPNLRIFIISGNLAIRQIRRDLFQTWQFFFKFQPKNTEIRHCWSLIQTFSFFHEILHLDKLEGADFKYDFYFIFLFSIYFTLTIK